jgi:hypothetical protein
MAWLVGAGRGPGVGGAGVLFGMLNRFEPAGPSAFWFNLVIPLAFAVPGAVLVGYRPTNPIGWILATMGLAGGLSEFLAEYGRYAIHTNPGSMPGGVLALWLAAFVWFPAVGARRDRLCPPRTSGSQCRADPARTRAMSYRELGKHCPAARCSAVIQVRGLRR